MTTATWKEKKQPTKYVSEQRNRRESHEKVTVKLVSKGKERSDVARILNKLFQDFGHGTPTLYQTIHVCVSNSLSLRRCETKHSQTQMRNSTINSSLLFLS